MPSYAYDRPTAYLNHPARASSRPSAVAATFSRRLAARFVDTVALSVFAAIGGMMAGVLTVTLWGPQGDPSAMKGLGAATLASLAGQLGYFVFSESFGGTSIGKALVGLRVVGADLQAPTVVQATMRTLALLVDGVGFGLVALLVMRQSSSNQRIGDRWASTYVVRESGTRDGAPRSTALVVGAAWMVAMTLLGGVVGRLP